MFFGINCDWDTKIVYTWINYNKVSGIANKDLGFIRDSYHQRKSDIWEAVRLHNIEDRPISINYRLYFGDWELDGIESRKSNEMFLICVERKTQQVVSIKVPIKHDNYIKLGIDTFMSRAIFISWTKQVWFIC